MTLQSFMRIAGVVTGLGLLAACKGDTMSPETGEPASVTRIMPRSPTRIFALPCEAIVQLPVVEVVASGRPVAHARVTFAYDGPGGAGMTYSTFSDDQGLAAPQSWRLGCESGQYRLIVSAGDAPEVVFIAHAKGQVVRVYDLLDSESVPVPQGTGQAQYLLFDDGSFSHLRDGKPTAFAGWYEEVEIGTIVFNLPPSCSGGWYREMNCVFSKGSLTGSSMTVFYTDWLNFDTETYKRRD